MQQYLTGDGIVAAVLVVLAIVWASNMVFSFIASARKEKERAQAPFARIDASISEIRTDLQLLKARVDAHDTEVSDLHAGQSAICRGVQALLEHELHNGNDDEMRAAADGIGKWLRTR